MSNQLDAEGGPFDAVADLTDEELTQRVRAKAEDVGLRLGDEHLDVVRTLVSHYKDVCKT